MRITAVEDAEDRPEPVDAGQALRGIGVLPDEKKTLKIGNTDRLDFPAQTIERIPVDAREQTTVAPFELLCAAEAPAQDDAFAFPLRQQHIADATGLTPVHVSRVIGKFRQAGLMEIKGRSLRILDIAELRRIAVMR